MVILYYHREKIAVKIPLSKIPINLEKIAQETLDKEILHAAITAKLVAIKPLRADDSVNQTATSRLYCLLSLKKKKLM